MGSTEGNGALVHFQEGVGKQKKRPIFTRKPPRPPFVEVWFRDVLSTNKVPWSCDFNDSRFSKPTVVAALRTLTWHKGKAWFSTDIQGVIASYIEEFDFDIFPRRTPTDTEKLDEYFEWCEHARCNLQHHGLEAPPNPDDGYQIKYHDWMHSSDVRHDLTTPEGIEKALRLALKHPWGPFKSYALSVIFTDEDRKRIWAERDKVEKKFKEGPMKLYELAVERFKAEEQEYLESKAKHRTNFINKRIEKLDMGGAIDKVMSSQSVQLMDKGGDSGATNHKIRARAIELAEAYLLKQSIIDRNRGALAAVCVCRAACENGIGLRFWDVQTFVENKKAFNEKNRDLRSKLEIKNIISRRKMLDAFVAFFANRVASLKNKAITPKERHKMQCLVAWIGTARIGRIDSEGPNAPRKLKCLPLFLDMLVSEDDRIKPITEFLPEEKEECIRTESIAATVVYLVLSVRPTKKNPPVTEKQMHLLTGVHHGVIMACKHALQNAIKRAYGVATDSIEMDEKEE